MSKKWEVTRDLIPGTVMGIETHRWFTRVVRGSVVVKHFFGPYDIERAAAYAINEAYGFKVAKWRDFI